MSNERDELFQLMLGRTTTKAVERIIAAGYRKPRMVTTVEELDALPRWSVVRDRTGYIGHRFPGGWRTLVVNPHSSPWLTDTLEDVALPATILHEPTA